jgi:hypothetical protein
LKESARASILLAGGRFDVDVPEAPAIVIERPAPCPDVATAMDLLKRTLAPTLAPRGSWSVIARFSRKGSSMTVEGEITDEVDAPVAHRVLTEPGHECAPLARAVGVWASLVLDAEVERVSHASAPAPALAAGRPPVSERAVSERAPPARAYGAAADAEPDPAVVEEDKPPPEASILLAHPEGERTLEFGVSMFLMGGTGSGMMLGPTAFGVIEAGRGWFLRPALFFGQTLDGVGLSGDVDGTLVAARFDTCGRIPGFYIERHGIQLDVCAGLEAGGMHVEPHNVGSSDMPFFALGPSVTLRGELGNGLALMIRGVMDFNVVRETIATTDFDPSVLVGRAEVGLSWQLR